MAEVINYWPDPQFRTTIGDAPFVAANIFPNPSPTVDLTGWTAVSGGSVTRVAGGMYPGNTHKAQVVNGVTLRGANTTSVGNDFNFTGKIKALTAMTITISGAMETAGQTFTIRTVGWGNFGWGEEITYAPGATKTFTAGEECLFRIYCGESNTIAGPTHRILITLSGTGTFELDGISQWTGVDDGAGDGDASEVPNMFPYFSGDTPDDENFTYEWYGTPHNSASLQKAKKAKYAYSTYEYIFNDELPLVPEQAFSVVKDGEHRLAIRSDIMFGGNGADLFDGVIPGTIPEGTRVRNNIGIDLPDGKNYCISYDLISDYQQYYYGYAEPQWGGGLYPYVAETYPGHTYQTHPDSWWPDDLAYNTVAGYSPYRKRIALPFPAPSQADARIRPYISVGMNWVSGDIYITNVGIFEIGAILHRYDGLPDATDCIWDLTTMGIVPGKSYHANVEYDRPNSKPAFEYRVGTGAWTTIVASTLETVSPEEIYAEQFDFTVPANATEVRLRLTGNLTLDQWGYGNGVGTFDLFEAPPEFFDGDTPDGGGYTYSWTGTPYASTSIRSDAPAGPTAQVWVDGVAKTVSEMRVVKAGVLTPVSEAGR